MDDNFFRRRPYADAGIDAYKKAWEEGRIQKRLDDSGYPKSLDVLAEGVEDFKSPTKSKMYFLRRIPRDPFATDTASPPSGGISSTTVSTETVFRQFGHVAACTSLLMALTSDSGASAT